MLGGFTATSYMSFLAARSSANFKTSKESLPLASENILSAIRNDLNQNITITIQMANNTFSKNWLLNGEENKVVINDYLQNIAETSGAFTTFLISDITKRYYHPNGLLRYVEPHLPGDAWYFKAREESHPYDVIVSEDEMNDSNLSIFINHRIFDDQKNFLGITGLGMELDLMQSIIDESFERYGRRISLIDRSGKLYFKNSSQDDYGNIELHSGLNQIKNEILNLESSASYSIGGKNTFVSIQHLDAFNWILLIEEDEESFQGPIFQTLITNIIWALVISAATIYLAQLTIKKYQHQIESIAEEDKKSKIKAEEANQAKNFFIASMSHELRTPLNAIIGFSEMTKEETIGEIKNKRYVEYASIINKSGKHLLSIINNLLDLNKIESGKMEINEDKVTIPTLFKNVKELLEQLSEEAMTPLHFDIAPNTPSLYGDPKLLKQILINLVNNSIKYSEQGSDIYVKAGLSDFGKIWISVKDNGQGMTEDEIEIAKEFFGQIKDPLNYKKEGTGLGLPLVIRMMEMHGGKVSISSVKGKGTDITLHFPAERTCKID